MKVRLSPRFGVSRGAAAPRRLVRDASLLTAFASRRYRQQPPPPRAPAEQPMPHAAFGWRTSGDAMVVPARILVVILAALKGLTLLVDTTPDEASRHRISEPILTIRQLFAYPRLFCVDHVCTGSYAAAMGAS